MRSFAIAVFWIGCASIVAALVSIVGASGDSLAGVGASALAPVPAPGRKLKYAVAMHETTNNRYSPDQPMVCPRLGIHGSISTG